MKTYAYAALAALVALSLGVAASPDWQHAIGTLATVLARPVFLPLIELINVPAFVYVLASALLIAGLVACAAYWSRAVAPQLRRLRQIRTEIEELPLPGVRDSAARRRDAMLALGALIRRHMMFVTAWAEYQTAGKAGDLPAAPFGHFVDNEPPLARERGGLMQSLPGYFTSLGLIFTFVGLVVALYFAAKGFRSGDIQQARVAITKLLNAASFKFLTSVAALVSALLISLCHRTGLSLIAGSRRLTANMIEAFLSNWREHAAGIGSPPPRVDSQALLERLDTVASALGAMTRRLDVLVERFDTASVREHDHAIG